jgi:hypothetical protein
VIRLLIKGTRADGERAAKQFGVNHIGFEDPGPDEGQKGSVVVGMCDDIYSEQVAEWFNSDPAEGVFVPGSVFWFKNA